MPSEQPQIARPRHRMLRSRRRVVGVGKPLRAVSEQIAEFKLAKPGQSKVKPAELQFAELQAEELAVPTRVQGELVVGDDIGALLRIRPATRNHYRDLGIAKLPGSKDRCVASYNSARLVSEHRVRPSPLLHARRNLRYLSLGVRPGILRIRNQPVDRPPLNLIRRPSRLARGRDC
jgi:hypothetical protein